MDSKMKTFKSQAYFWTKEWQEAEREASEDIKAGLTDELRICVRKVG